MKRIQRIIRKRMKVVAFRHAQFYTRKWFRKYIVKFVRKIGKMSKKAGNDQVHRFMTVNRTALTETAVKVLCSAEVERNQFYLFNEANKPALDGLKWKLVGISESKVTAPPPCSREIIEATVEYAFALRKELNASTSVAKTKVQEYWTDRLPPMILFLGAVLAVKLYFKEFGSTADYLTVGLTCTAFLGAFVMVYLRLPHAVDAATKQKASDFYIASKDGIGRLVTNVTSADPRCIQHHCEKVRGCFDSINRVMDDVAEDVPLKESPLSPPQSPKGNKKNRDSRNSLEVELCEADDGHYFVNVGN